MEGKWGDMAVGRHISALMAGLITIFSVQPAHACWSEAEQAAVKISKLNMMLMVNALRCRQGPDNFLPEYNRFVKNNNSLLGGQNRLIQTGLARQIGAGRASLALDRMTIGFANDYGAGGGGNCGELKSLSADLGKSPQNLAYLAGIADQMVDLPVLPGGNCPARIASRK